MSVFFSQCCSLSLSAVVQKIPLLQRSKATQNIRERLAMPFRVKPLQIDNVTLDLATVENYLCFNLWP